MNKELVHCIDCLEAMRELADNSVDHVITDPPYDERTHAGARTGGSSSVILSIDFQPSNRLLEPFIREALRIAKRWIIAFCSLEMFGDYQRLAGDTWIRAGFWRRSDGCPQFTGDRPGQPGEGVAIMHRSSRKRWNGGGKHAYWTCGVERHERVHPTQKPVKLMMELIRDFTDEGDLVLDPFAGSGSTGVAAIRLGRRFLGFESNDEYCRTANERLAAERYGQDLQSYREGQGTLGI